MLFWMIMDDRAVAGNLVSEPGGSLGRCVGVQQSWLLPGHEDQDSHSLVLDSELSKLRRAAVLAHQ